MKISVVIATFNRAPMLARTLPALLEQDLPAADFEIVVVVDGSTDGTATMLQSLRPACGFLILEQANTGKAAAVNAGVRKATGELIVICDDDLLCPANWLRTHVEAHPGISPSVVFGPIRVADEWDRRPETLWTRQHLDGFFERISKPLPWNQSYVGANCSLPRALFLNAGGYDEVTTGRRMEDVELGIRIAQAGIPFIHESRATVRHVSAKSPSDLVRDAAHDGAALVAVCRKHPGFRRHSALAETVNGNPKRRVLLRMLPEFTDRILNRLGPSRRILYLRIAAASLRGAISEAGSWRRLKAAFGLRVSALLYHDVAPPATGAQHPELTVPPRRFQSQIRWLKRLGYTGISAADWHAWLEQGAPLPRKPILITFDDAYADIGRHALPVLRCHGFKADVFVITGMTGGVSPWDNRTLMSGGEIANQISNNIAFGAHTRHHSDLTAVAPACVKAEVAGSAADLSRYPSAVKTFAYPYGSWNAAARAEVAQHFDLAFTCDEGINDLRTDPHLLRRTMVQPGDTWLDIAFRAALGWSPLNRVRARVRLRSRLRLRPSGL